MAQTRYEYEIKVAGARGVREVPMTRIRMPRSGVCEGMDWEKHPTPAGHATAEHPPEGCLVAAIRIPVRIVVLVLVVPIRLAWDAVAAGGRVVWRRGLVPLARALFVVPWVWLWRRVLAPVARGVGAALTWLGRALFVWPWVALWGYVLAPVGRAVAVALRWLGGALFVWPWIALWRHVLAPVGRGCGPSPCGCGGRESSPRSPGGTGA